MASSGYWRRGLKPVRYRYDDALARMDPLGFERLVADYYSKLGFRVEHVGTGGRNTRYDGGIDLKLYRDDEYVIVQCKRATAMQVPHNEVHQFLGIMHTERANRAIFITTGEYTNAALDKFRGVDAFDMIDGRQLREMLGPELAPDRTSTDQEMPRDYELSAPSDARSNTVISSGRTSNQARHFELLKVGASVLVLIVLATWQCSRPNANDVAPERSVRADHQNSPEAKPVVPAPSPSAPDEIAPVSRPPTEAEIRESQRKADEAMKVLEASTPEV